MSNVSVEQEIEAVKKVVKRWAKVFSAKDAKAVMELWDETYEKTMHQAEEFPDPLRGYDEIKFYNEGMSQTVQNPRGHSLIDLDADVIGDAAWVYLRGTIVFDIPGMPEPISGEVKQTFFLRKVHNTWKFIHYHESRETPDIRPYFYHVHPRGDQLKKDTEGDN